MGSDPVDDVRFVGYRRKLIEDIRARGIDDLELLQLFDRVPRHIFLPEGVQPRAYEDGPIPIGFGQTASQPSLQAKYLSILQPTTDDKVLEIGTGCGYLTALLALMADRVYSVERVRELSQRARRALDAFGVKNVALLVGQCWKLATLPQSPSCPFWGVSPGVRNPLDERYRDDRSR